MDKNLSNQLYGDDVRIRQILINLLNNAVKYTHQGEICFTVQDHSSADRNILYFEVRDTGIGIKEKDLPRLREAFERIEVSRNRNIEGTRLGMSIVSDLLHLMGSQLQVHSVYGKGSTFSFELAQPRISAEKIGDYEQRIRYMHQGERYRCKFWAPAANILVVDDNDTNRMVFCNLLKQTKMQIKEVDSGTACLEAVQKEHFDLIFLDYDMPVVDGKMVLEEIRANEQSRDIPVVFLTAINSKEKILAVAPLNPSDYLLKPVNAKRILETAQRITG